MKKKGPFVHQEYGGVTDFYKTRDPLRTCMIKYLLKIREK